MESVPGEQLGADGAAVHTELARATHQSRGSLDELWQRVRVDCRCKAQRAEINRSSGLGFQRPPHSHR